MEQAYETEVRFDAEAVAKLSSIGINVAEFANGFRAADPCVVASQLAAFLDLRVFPVRQNKKTPHIRAFQDGATTSLKQILRWQQQFPGCDWAVLTGRDNDLIVLDVDGKQGCDDLIELEGKLGRLPKTAICKSPRLDGGYHVWLKPPPGSCDLRNQQPLLGTKIDVRGWHGYVVIAGSRHKSGSSYAWVEGRAPDECGIAECPPQWWEWLPKKLEAPETRKIATRCGPGIHIKRQHDARSLLIGDGPGFGGFENPIYRNAIHYFLKSSGEAPTGPIIEVLRDMIIAAPKGLGRDVSRYLSGQDLLRTVDRARAFVNNLKDQDNV